MRAAGYVEDASESDDDDKPPKPSVPAPAPKVEAPDLLPVSLPLRYEHAPESCVDSAPLCHSHNTDPAI